MSEAKDRRRLVTSLSATTTVGYGILFYAYGVLLVPMEHDLGWRRSVLTGAFSGALLVAALLTVPVGRWIDRHHPRPLLTAAAVVGTAFVLIWGHVHGQTPFFVVWIVLGACMPVLFYEPAFAIITKRLHGAERHRALTTITLVAGLASTIFGPLTSRLEGALGWRRAVFVLAALLGAFTIPVFVIGLRKLALGRATPHERDVLPRDALASPRFWVLTGAYLLSSITTFAIAVHLVPYLRGVGWTSNSSATVLGAVGLVQVLGRSLFSRLTMRRAAGPLGTWVLGAKGVGIAILVASPTLPGVVAFLVIYGGANGLQTLTRATVVADLYGTAHYGAISAVISSIGAIGGAVAPFLVAAAIELVGNDEPVLWGLAALALASAVTNEMAVGSRIHRADRLAEAGLDTVPPDLEG